MKKIYLIMILFFAIASGVFAQTANIVTLTLKAKSGEAEAQNALGEAYYDGKGVTENLPEAVKWFTKAAEQENAKAEYNLGNCYYYGYGVYENYGEAVKWYTKAAEQGCAEAQNSLGYYYDIRLPALARHQQSERACRHESAVGCACTNGSNPAERRHSCQLGQDKLRRA